MKILGIVTETHDAGIALLEDGVPVLIIEEERLNRQKHTREFPTLALEEAFDAAGHNFADVDVITTPWDMSRLRRTVFKAVFGRLPASLSLILPSAQTTQDHGIVLLNFWLRHQFEAPVPRPAFAQDRQRRPSRIARRDLLCLAVRGGQHSRHRWLW